METWASLVAQTVKNLPAMRETQVRSLNGEDHLEKEMGTHSSILDWQIPWTEEPGGLQSMGSQRVSYDLWIKPQPPPIPPLCKIQERHLHRFCQIRVCKFFLHSLDSPSPVLICPLKYKTFKLKNILRHIFLLLYVCIYQCVLYKKTQ